MTSSARVRIDAAIVGRNDPAVAKRRGPGNSPDFA
jgi:hypothetical protein